MGGMRSLLTGVLRRGENIRLLGVMVAGRVCIGRCRGLDIGNRGGMGGRGRGDWVRVLLVLEVIFGVGINVRGFGERFKGAVCGDCLFATAAIVFDPFVMKTLTFCAACGTAGELLRGRGG